MAQRRNRLLLCACLSQDTPPRAIGLLAGEIHSPDLDWEGSRRNRLLLCACLSQDTPPRAIDLLAGEIHSPDLDWEGIIGIAGRHLLLPALRKALVKKRLINALPTADFLDEAYRLNTARNQRLKAQSSEIVQTLSRAEITSVLLKGGAFLFDCKDEDLGMRMMLDLDILVPEDRFEESVAVLRHLGYERCSNSHPPHHYPALFRPGEIATVELHRRLEKQEQLLPPSLVFDHSVTLKDGTGYVCIPSSTHRIMHNISHAAIHHDEYLRMTEGYNLLVVFDEVRFHQGRLRHARSPQTGDNPSHYSSIFRSVPRPQMHGSAVAARADSIAVEFDLVQPSGAGRRLRPHHRDGWRYEALGKIAPSSGSGFGMPGHAGQYIRRERITMPRQT